jgi:hypothetical protein
LVVLVTVAENESVSPSNTLPELGETLTVIAEGGGGGGGAEPPPTPPQAARNTPRARAKNAREERGRSRASFALTLCVDRICGRDRILFAKADRGPASTRRGAGGGPAPGKIFGCSKVPETKGLSISEKRRGRSYTFAVMFRNVPMAFRFERVPRMLSLSGKGTCERDRDPTSGAEAPDF